jgi:hypothetical protein
MQLWPRHALLCLMLVVFPAHCKSTCTWASLLTATRESDPVLIRALRVSHSADHWLLRYGRPRRFRLL